MKYEKEVNAKSKDPDEQKYVFENRISNDLNNEPDEGAMSGMVNMSAFFYENHLQRYTIICHRHDSSNSSLIT